MTITHLLFSLLADGDTDAFKRKAGWLAMPDALRCWTGKREYTHFNVSSYDEDDVCWWKLPPVSPRLTKQQVDASIAISSHISPQRPAVIGTRTDVSTFIRHNQDGNLTDEQYACFLLHLQEDVIDDRFMRCIIDCSRKYDDVFVYDGRTIDGKTLRHDIITPIEQQMHVMTCLMIRDAYGITCDNRFVDGVVKPSIALSLPLEVTHSTVEYMMMPSDIDKAITSNSLSGVNETVEWDKIRSVIEDALTVAREM